MAEDFLLSSSVSKNFYFYFMIKKSAQKEKKRQDICTGYLQNTNYKLATESF